MKRTLAALMVGTVAFTALTIGSSANAAPLVTSAPERAPQKAEIKDIAGGIISFAKTAYDLYSACMGNIEVGQPCMNGDGDNIRQSLKELKAIQASMEANQDELMQRLGELDVSIKEARVEGYVRELRGIEVNSSLAIQAWVAYIDCLVAKSNNAPECTSFLDDGRTRTVPVATGLSENRATFLFYANELPTSIATTVATYTGTSGSGDRNSLAYALWRLAKVELDTDADVRVSAIRTSQFTPIVTPAMASQVNRYLDYYLSLFLLYGNILETRSLLLRDEAKVAGDTPKANGHQLDADRYRANIERRIEGTSADSANGIREVYQLTPLAKGEIMMANASGTGVIIYAGDRTVDGDRSMVSSDLSILGQGLKNYGTFSKLAAAQPGAFPTDGWYEVTASTMKIACFETATGKQETYEVIADKPWPVLAELKVPVGPMTVRMKLLDAKPDWNDRYPYSKGCLNRDYSSYMPISLPFGAILNANAPWPATFDWKIYEYNGYKPWGYGAFLDAPVAMPVNRVFEEQVGNKMVRWPSNFTPQMPAAY